MLRKFNNNIFLNVGYQVVAIQMFRLALKNRKAALETARIPSSIHKTGQLLTGMGWLKELVISLRHGQAGD